MDVLATGYFLVAREAFKQMKVQDIGGSMVFWRKYGLYWFEELCLCWEKCYSL